MRQFIAPDKVSFLTKKYCYPRVMEMDGWETSSTFWTNMKQRLVSALYKNTSAQIFLLLKKSTTAIKTDQAGKPVPFIMLLNI